MDPALEIEAKIDFIEDTILTKSSVFSGYLSDYHLENFLTLFKYFSASLPVRNRQLVDDCYEYLLNKNW